ncbi:MAG: DegQ family serine endoprotease [Desulfosarcinaceae bacterium]
MRSTPLIKLLPSILSVLLILGFTFPLPSAFAKNEAKMVPVNFTELAKKARTGVVNIRTVKTIKGGGRVYRHFYGNPFGGHGRRDPFEEFFRPFMDDEPQRDLKQRSLGSGFIIDKKGYIVTNNHVIEDADQIKVKLYDDKEFDATLVGRDSKTDLALIKIEGAKDLQPLKMGDSDTLDVGTWVVAIGSPFGLEQTVTAGIVSAKGRIIGSGPYDDFIQTDASINPGNSGGPLLDLNGEVMGINTAIVASGQGIGFAIPVNLAKGIVDQLKEGGEVTRGWLGVAIQDLTPELAEYYGIKGQQGVLIAQVFKDDPADKAGLKPNDVVTAIDGRPVSTGRELSQVIADSQVGKKTNITFVRDGKQQTVSVRLVKRDDEKQLAARPVNDGQDELGLRVRPITPELARQFGIDASEGGVLVGRVKAGSKADDAGVQTGDIIKEINRQPIQDMQDYEKLTQKGLKGDDGLSMLIKRRNAGYLVVKIAS